MRTWKTIGRVMPAWAVLVLCMPGVGRAEDPLDEKDGTEDWDQVVDAPARSHRAAPPPQDLAEIRRELGEYQQWRNGWDAAREEFIRERTRHRILSERYQKDQARREAEAKPPARGAAVVPDRSLDRLLDAELGESGRAPARAKAPAKDVPAEARTPAAPPATPTPAVTPTQAANLAPEPAPAGNDAEWGGSTFASPSDDEEVRAAAKFLKEQREREEAQRRIEEERKRQQAAEEARKKREEEEAAAAAMRLLKQQEEEIKKEQENLRQKANLKTDSEGQVVDPDLQEEQGE
ncbi:MAG: hypothetical protein GYA21_06160 [Myxococcales bacterium]|nr:hypothetical protein [Myxococcales bacterium]